MSIEDLRGNTERSEEIVKKIMEINEKMGDMLIGRTDGEELTKNLLLQLKVLNNSIPDLLKNISFYKKISDSSTENKSLIKVSYLNNLSNEEEKINLIVNKKEEGKLLKSLSAENTLYKKIKSEEKEEGDTSSPKRHSGFTALSNSIFKNISPRLANGEFFSFIRTDLRKISSPFIITSYISMTLFGTMIGLIAGILIFLIAFVMGAWIFGLSLLVALPVIIFLLFYQFPASQRKALEKEINQELPFLTIYMSAISGSGIEPSKMFGILSTSKDYPFSSREIRKLNNYINFYGYDAVSALKMASKNCPSEKLSLVFDGLATTISSGGRLTEFLDKHSETLLFDYRLEREKYTRVAETFLNIYISVLIAAPMILMLLFILMSLTGFGSIALSPGNLTILMIMIISFLNIGFLLLLNSKQPKF
jgi:pilus assembly protein TadC